MILFRLSSANHDGSEIVNDVAYKQLYAMEAACPHLGADMSLADIEEYHGEDGEEPSTVVVCPWHRQALSSLCPFRILFLGLLNVSATGMILTWPQDRARPGFEHAFMRLVSESQSRMGRRKFGLKRRKGVLDGNWHICDLFPKVGLGLEAFWYGLIC